MGALASHAMQGALFRAMAHATDTRICEEEYYMRIAMAVRARANCLGNRVGAIIVRENRIVSTGYNGTPSGMQNCLEGGCHRCNCREEYPAGVGYDLCICVHAEQNALLSAARFGIALQGGTAYTTLQPCFGCLKEMLQAKIEKVYYLHEWKPSERSRAEYERMLGAFSGGVHCLSIEDPDATWAVSTLRKAAQEAETGTSDETGHGGQ